VIAPTEWPSARLGDLLKVKYGKSLQKERRLGGAVPVYGSNGVVGEHDTALTRGPTIIIGRKGSSGAVNSSDVPCWPIDTTYFIDEFGPFVPSFLEHLLRSLGLEELDRSTAIPGLNRDQLYDLQVPTPSRDVQEHIADQLDKTLDSGGSAHLHLAAAGLAIERFRQAILAAACSGRLTADWREQNSEPSSVVPALSELRSKKKERKQREQAVSLDLPELPETYVLASLEECAVLLEYGTSKKCVTDSAIGVPVLRMGNIQDGQLDFSDLKYCSVDGEIERLMLEPGDLLFNRTNSPELVGKSAVYQSGMPASFASYLIRVRFDNRVALPDFVNYWLNSAWGRAWAQLAKTDGVSQSNINGSKLALMTVPLPPIDEQAVIVERASQVLMAADAIHARIETASSAVDKSSRAVLAKAFRGQLALAAAV